MSNTCWKEANGSCDHVCPAKKRIQIADYGYVGGYYGNCSESAMMKELQNGPIVINFQPGTGFQMIGDSADKVFVPSRDYVEHRASRKNFDDGWERVGHSVLIYGYGKDDEGRKFWKMQNSWGSGWGNDGKTNVERGVDAMGIESNAEWATPVVISEEI